MRVALLLPATVAVTLGVVSAPRVNAQSADGAISPRGRIDGRVVTSSADLLPDVVVTLASAARDGEDRTVATTASGGFTFENVPPGRYVLRASKAGYTDQELVGASVRASAEISLREGEHLADVRIAMRRTASIAGRILRPDGTPAPGTEVVAAVRDGARLSPLPEFRTTSEWNGRYEITGVPPGAYLIVVRPPLDAAVLAGRLPVDVSAAPLRFDPTLYPGVPESEPGGTVTVHEGVASEGIDVWLMPAPQRFAVSGRVFWPEGLEVERIVIEYGGSRDVRSGVWYVDDPGGLFTLEGISRGTLVLLARAESNRGPVVGLASTDVLIGPVEEVRLDLSTPGSVAGRVLSERPLPAAAAPRVTLTHRLLTVSPLFPAEEAAVGPDGRFQIPHARGTYRVEVSGLPSGWRVHRVQRNGVTLEGHSLIVGAADRVTDLDILVGP